MMTAATPATIMTEIAHFGKPPVASSGGLATTTTTTAGLTASSVALQQSDISAVRLLCTLLTAFKRTSCGRLDPENRNLVSQNWFYTTQTYFIDRTMHIDLSVFSTIPSVGVYINGEEIVMQCCTK